MKGFLQMLTTKTALGGYLTVGSWVFAQPEVTAQVIVGGLGAILTILGGRHAIEKSGPQK